MVAGLRRSTIVVLGVVFSLVISLSGIAMAVSAPAVSVLEPITSGLSTPLKTALDQNGDMYVADPRSGGVVVLDQYGAVKQVIRTEKPVNGLALLGSGKLVVGQGDVLSIVDQNGAVLARLGAGVLVRVSAVAVDAVGSIYVADVGSHSIKKLTMSGGLVAEFGAAELVGPSSLAIAAVGGVQRVVVVDSLTGYVMFYSLDGALVANNISSIKFSYPSGVAFEFASGALSRVYVLDMFQGQIQALDASGQLLSYVSNYGAGRGTLLTPSDVQFDQLNRRLLIANGLGNLISLGIDGGSNPVNAVQPNLNISQKIINVTAPSVVVSGSVDAGCSIVGAADTGAKVGAASFSGATSWILPVDGLLVGRNIISITAKNQYGTTITDTVTVEYQPPYAVLTVDNLKKDFKTAQSALVLTGTVESGAAVKVFNAATGSTVDAVVADGVWSVNISLVEGVNALTITAAGKSFSAATITNSVTLDTTAPAIALSMIADGSNSAGRDLTVSGNITEANNYSLTVKINDKNAQVVTPVNNVFSMLANLAIGANVITITAVDELNNATVVTRTVNYDPETPVIAIQSPADGAFTNVKNVVVTGSVSVASGITVNGVAAELDPATLVWTATVQLASGMNSIQVVANYENKSSSRETHITYSDVLPVVTVSAPSQDVATNNPSLNVTGQYSSNLPIKSVTAVVNGKTVPVDVSNGAFSVFYAMDAENAYSVAVTVVDAANNSSTVQRNVIYDVTPPMVTADKPQIPVPSVLSGTVEAGAVVKVKTGAENVYVATVLGQTWSATLSNVSYDPAKLEVVATDAAGNSSAIRVNLPVPDGDLDNDGSVTVKDALAALKLAVSGVEATDDQLAHGDVNKSGGRYLDVADGILILRKALKLVTW